MLGLLYCCVLSSCVVRLADAGGFVCGAVLFRLTPSLICQLVVIFVLNRCNVYKNTITKKLKDHINKKEVIQI